MILALIGALVGGKLGEAAGNRLSQLVDKKVAEMPTTVLPQQEARPLSMRLDDYDDGLHGWR